MQFRIGTAQAELGGAPLGGARFPCECVLAGTGERLLEFAGVEPARVLAVPCAQQLAEKVHAYTFPWEGRTNTRSKDLVDLVLLIEAGPPDRAEVVRALRATFATRNTHPLPEALPQPPGAWQAEFAAMAAEAQLSLSDYREGFGILERFWASLV
jgi:hypothetical protein